MALLTVLFLIFFFFNLVGQKFGNFFKIKKNNFFYTLLEKDNKYTFKTFINIQVPTVLLLIITDHTVIDKNYDFYKELCEKLNYQWLIRNLFVRYSGIINSFSFIKWYESKISHILEGIFEQVNFLDFLMNKIKSSTAINIIVYKFPLERVFFNIIHEVSIKY